MSDQATGMVAKVGPKAVRLGRDAALVLWFTLAVLAGLAFHMAMTLDADVATPLMQAEALFAGQQLYVDVLEINPPWFIYLDIPAVILANALGSSKVIGLHLYFHALILVSLLLCLPLARRRPVLAWSLPLILLLLPGQAFGQREHLLMVFLLPWILLQTRAGGRRAGSPLFALWACMGLLIKPFFALIPLSIFAARAWQSRSPRPLFVRDAWIMGIVLVAYVVFIILFLPIYLERVIPSALAIYDVFNHGLGLMTLVRIHVLAGLVVGAYAVYVAGKPGGRAAGHGRLILMAAACGGFASYYAQRKGWEYHAVPAVTSTALYLLWVTHDLRAERVLRRLASITLAAVVVMRWDAPVPSWSFWQQPAPAFARQFPGLRYGAFSGSSRLGFPLAVEGDVVWTLRIYSMMTVAGLYVARAEGREDDRHRAMHRDLGEITAEDIRLHRPDAMFVDRQILGDIPFDYIAFLSEVPAFREEWRAFVFCRNLDDRVALWIRIDSGLCNAH